MSKKSTAKSKKRAKEYRRRIRAAKAGHVDKSTPGGKLV